MKIIFVFYIVLFAILPVSASAADSNIITPVFPVRAPEYWRQGGDYKHFNFLQGLVAKYSLPATWLLHYDVIISDLSHKIIPSDTNEVGIFLEVTRKLADEAKVIYRWQEDNWSSAYRAFLSGYNLSDRHKLIDRVFASFKDKYGFYPKSYGAWYIDVYSMEYIKNKYGARVILGLADQYSTDGYQTWGQYINQPYIVSKKSAIEPAADTFDSTGILKLQWAPREPTLFYGKTVASSNYSAQVNDYHRYNHQNTAYLSQLLYDIVINPQGKISQAVIGIEVGELESQYFPELENQFRLLRKLSDDKKVTLSTTSEFSATYFSVYPSVSPSYSISSTKNGQSTYWFFSPSYRLGIRQVHGQTEVIDLRYYQYSVYRDNDQVLADPHKNLVRVVPSRIDALNMDNAIFLTDKPIQVQTSSDALRINWPDGFLSATASGINASADIVHRLSPLSTVKLLKTGPCTTEYGAPDSRFPCLPLFLYKAVSYLPDFVYSSLDGRHYLGLRTGEESFWGIRFPGLKIGKFQFSFSVLSSFISLKNKLTPSYSWAGKQEAEVLYFEKINKILPKGLNYGQSDLIAGDSGKMIFENGYYAVFQ